MPLTLGQQVIPGFTQGLLGIKQGEKRRMVIPARLAYGDTGAPGRDLGDVKKGSIVPPNSALIFEIECVKMTPAETSK
jgi:FKBP-type peptidyl-prolyl cis-trans isomerase